MGRRAPGVAPARQLEPRRPGRRVPLAAPLMKLPGGAAQAGKHRESLGSFAPDPFALLSDLQLNFPRAPTSGLLEEAADPTSPPVPRRHKRPPAGKRRLPLCRGRRAAARSSAPPGRHEEPSPASSCPASQRSHSGSKAREGEGVSRSYWPPDRPPKRPAPDPEQKGKPPRKGRPGGKAVRRPPLSGGGATPTRLCQPAPPPSRLKGRAEAAPVPEGLPNGGGGVCGPKGGTDSPLCRGPLARLPPAFRRSRFPFKDRSGPVRSTCCGWWERRIRDWPAGGSLSPSKAAGITG